MKIFKELFIFHITNIRSTKWCLNQLCFLLLKFTKFVLFLT